MLATRCASFNSPILRNCWIVVKIPAKIFTPPTAIWNIGLCSSPILSWAKGSAATKQLQAVIDEKKNAGEIERIIDEYYDKHKHYPNAEELTAELATELQKETAMAMKILQQKIADDESSGNVVLPGAEDDSKV